MLERISEIVADEDEGRAVPFVTMLLDEHGSAQFSVSEEAKQILSQIKHPIRVVSIVGMCKTGKSFLLNRILLRRQDGFQVGSTVDACTKGLWMWNVPLEATSPSGEPVSIILIDSEGLGSPGGIAETVHCIFALALCISSCYIFNSLCNINESDLENLASVVELANCIRTRNSSKESGDDPTYLDSFLLWVARDFAQPLIGEDGADISATQYFENALQDLKGHPERVEGKNRVRALLRGAFANRDFCPLVRPVEDETLLQTLNTCENQVLRPKFRQQMTVRGHDSGTAQACRAQQPQHYYPSATETAYPDADWQTWGKQQTGPAREDYGQCSAEVCAWHCTVRGDAALCSRSVHRKRQSGQREPPHPLFPSLAPLCHCKAL
eukprot:1968695-Rhodomonas_salina.2